MKHSPPVLKEVPGTTGCLGPGAVCKRREERCYQSTAVKRHQDPGFDFIHAVL